MFWCRRSAGWAIWPCLTAITPTPGLDQIAARARVDVTGLDGALCFECGGAVFHGGDAERAAFASKIMPALEAHYGMASREIPEGEFWRLHPLGGKS